LSTVAVKKSTKKKKARTKKAEAPPDLRAALAPTPKNFEATIEAVRGSLTALPPEPEPVPGDLVSAMLHITFAEGVACGIGQECVRRIYAEFVDLNEFRLTEAFEIERLLGDLEIPRLFERSVRARDSIAEVYNDQNAVTLEGLREASITDRNMFFQRIPVLKPPVVHFIVSIMAFEEILFSDRSTLRLQQRLGLDPKNKGVNEFFGELKPLIRPYGHLPITVGPESTDGKALTDPPLSAASLVMRLAPAPKRK
jgi:hypothetical protein